MNYLILTEYKNERAIIDILNTHFDAYNSWISTGRWKGQEETSLNVLICHADPNHVQQAAEEIKAYNQQESVMILALPGEVTLL